MLERKKAGPPCGTCLPYIMPGNIVADRIYRICSDQWTVNAMGRLIGIRLEAIEAALRIAGIPEEMWMETLDKVQTIGRNIADMLAARQPKDVKGPVGPTMRGK